MGRVRALYGERLHYCDLAYSALEGADALIVATEWNEFRRPDFEKVRHLLRQPLIFDGRNLYDPARMRQRGFAYFCIGRGASNPE